MKILMKNIWSILSETISEYIDDNGIKLSASLSYYTIFSLPPLLIVIISTCGIFFGADAIRGEIFGQINKFVGNDAALQIQNTLKNVTLSHSNFFANLLGVVMLLIGATGVFSEMQSSINFIWRLDAKPKRRFLKFIENRILSFSMVGCLGFLLLVSLMVNTLFDLISNRLVAHFPHIAVYLFYLNHIILFALVTLLFTLIFKTLPDGKISWKDAIIGSSVTSLLFMLGKFAISAYIGHSSLASVYGAAGSLIVILVWVYYSANILYFGAELTKVYAHAHGEKIIPNEYAVEIEAVKVEIEPEKTVE
ncbi:MAG: ribonuclease [Bacteroidota bacterium]|nr:ribonuclease [Bacteroidota bacterium]